jgi:hypothetical protein
VVEEDKPRFPWVIFCGNCEIQTPNFHTADEAVKYWNTRLSEAILRARVTATEEVYCNLIAKISKWGYKSAGQTLPGEINDAIFEADLRLADIQHGATAPPPSML